MCQQKMLFFIFFHSLKQYRGEAVRLLPILDRHFARPVRICFRRDKHLTPLAREFRDFTIAYLDLTS